MATRTREQRARDRVQETHYALTVSVAWYGYVSWQNRAKAKSDALDAFDHALAAYRRAVLAAAKGRRDERSSRRRRGSV